MMMVIPTESHVTLYYGRTMANTVGQVLEVLAWVLLAGSDRVAIRDLAQAQEDGRSGAGVGPCPGGRLRRG